MNAIHFFQPTTATPRQPAAPATAIAPPTPRQAYRERDFGVGYGTSSGYASARRYVDTRAQPRFRCS